MVKNHLWCTIFTPPKFRKEFDGGHQEGVVKSFCVSMPNRIEFRPGTIDTILAQVLDGRYP
ncbi:MAG: hypothetical protein D6680_02575 [Cyanobacteria bacterium J007]|nr:MAG: hypothetical protein D6680_02575 [Cyanobacteria bacterium J007]